MKYFILFAAVSLFSFAACGQRKPNTKSPLDTVMFKTSGGADVFIRYNRPSVRGRAIGTELEPKPGAVWRTGADSATLFQVSGTVKVEGKELPAGRYGLFTIANGDDWTIIFSNNPRQWGAFTYKESEDVLRVKVKSTKSASFTEQFTITAKDGKIDLLWGDYDVAFKVD